VILQGYGPTGFDVSNILKKVEDEESRDSKAVGPTESGTVHMNGSILVFPFGCFLWKVASPRDVTLESLSAVLLYRDPPLEYLFIGCRGDLPVEEMNRIRSAMQARDIVVEKLNVADAMGTFNILNAEDRQVAVALVIDETESDEED